MRIHKGASRLEQNKQGGEEPQEEIRWESRGQVMGGRRAEGLVMGGVDSAGADLCVFVCF